MLLSDLGAEVVRVGRLSGRPLATVAWQWGEDTYAQMAGIWGGGEQALPNDPPGDLEIVSEMPDGAKMPDLKGAAGAFTS